MADQQHLDIWAAVTEIVDEFKKAETAGATMSAVAMGYICLDTMAFLSMPDEKQQQTRADLGANYGGQQSERVYHRSDKLR